MYREDEALGAVSDVANARGDGAIAAEAREASRALASGRFNVAVLGQFKRGKSTLVNALLGTELLPADVVPLTSTVTIVEYGPRPAARVCYADGSEESGGVERLADWVSEEGNPSNVKGVQAVVVELPSPLLAPGLRLVDTPGIGSVFAPNSAATRRFLPRIDVAIVVLGSDPPISGEELALVTEVAPLAGCLRFVLNKSDRVREQTREKAAAFTREVLLGALGRDPGPLAHASARIALETGSEPGVDALREWIRGLARDSAGDLARASARRAVRHLSSRLLQGIDIERAALTQPIAELEGRVERFRNAMRDVEDLALAVLTRLRADTSVDWDAWQERRRELEGRRTEQVVEAVRTSLDRPPRRSREAMRREASEITRRLVADGVEAWRREAVAEFERHRTAMVARATSEANRLVARVASEAAAAFGTEIKELEPEPVRVELGAGVFEFVESTLALDASVWVVPLVDALLPRRAVAARAASRARRTASEWFRLNLYEVDRHLTDWLDALSRHVDAEVRTRLEALREEVLAAVAEGLRTREEGLRAIEEALARLAVQRGRLETALSSLGGIGDGEGSLRPAVFAQA